MKKVNLMVILLTLLLCGCKRGNQQFTLQGNVKNLGNDTIFIYSQQGEGKLDTIIVDKGSFRYTAPIDTLTRYSLLIKNVEIPFFADKAIQVKVQGDASALAQLQVTGGNTNDELNTFNTAVFSLKDSTAIINKADSFIRNHPFSQASIYVLDKYFVHKENPDYGVINSLILSMSGELQDMGQIKELSEIANKQEKVGIGKRAPSFNGKNTKGTYISLATFKDQYILINFWASWCDNCDKENATLKKIQKRFKKEKLGMVGVSLDINKKEWLQSIRKDTLSWEQINDFKGWDNSVAKLFGIESLPANVIIGPDQNIIAKNLKGQDLINQLEEIFKQKTSTK